MEPLVAALAGGAAGAAIATLARVPWMVRSHNRLVGEYDEELGNWVADESVRLQRELKRTTRRFAESGSQGERAHAEALAQVKEESLRAYRDSELAAKHRRAVLRDSEGWQHDLWRWMTVRGQLPPLRMPRKVKPLIDTWREPVSFGEISVQVSDPTSRDVDDMLAELAARQASAEGEPPRLPEAGEGEAPGRPLPRDRSAREGERVRHG
ncbi:MAG TPA: hypothetical protein VK920_03950 [Solirubrobacterales bacterium]|nr:hypothetical protein [Solirubrobacterales bacterium]